MPVGVWTLTGSGRSISTPSPRIRACYRTGTPPSCRIMSNRSRTASHSTTSPSTTRKQSTKGRSSDRPAAGNVPRGVTRSPWCVPLNRPVTYTSSPTSSTRCSSIHESGRALLSAGPPHGASRYPDAPRESLPHSPARTRRTHHRGRQHRNTERIALPLRAVGAPTMPTSVLLPTGARCDKRVETPPRPSAHPDPHPIRNRPNVTGGSRCPITMRARLLAAAGTP
jgi:hypothetical protein